MVGLIKTAINYQWGEIWKCVTLTPWWRRIIIYAAAVSAIPLGREQKSNNKKLYSTCLTIPDGQIGWSICDYSKSVLKQVILSELFSAIVFHKLNVWLQLLTSHVDDKTRQDRISHMPLLARMAEHMLIFRQRDLTQTVSNTRDVRLSHFLKAFLKEF